MMFYGKIYFKLKHFYRAACNADAV